MDDFSQMVLQEQSSLRAWISIFGIPNHYIDDIAQEVFLLAYRKWEKLEDRDDLGRWLRGVAKHIILNEKRKYVRRKHILNENITDILLHSTSFFDNEECALCDPDIVEKLQDCIGDLSDENQNLLHKKYSCDENSISLSKFVNKTPAAVRKILYKLRKVLYNCLEKNTGDFLYE